MPSRSTVITTLRAWKASTARRPTRRLPCRAGAVVSNTVRNCIGRRGFDKGHRAIGPEIDVVQLEQMHAGFLRDAERAAQGRGLIEHLGIGQTNRTPMARRISESMLNARK